MKEENLDLILVPSGLFIMFAYHLFLLYRVLRYPQCTVIGYENHHKKAWAERMIQDQSANIGLALQVISNSTSAATTLSSLSIALSSLIGTWIGSSSGDIFISNIIYGDTRASTISLKYISILCCFLVAFAAFIQSVRYYVHATFLLSTPYTDIPIEYVKTAVTRGTYFWSLGLRAYYFAATLILWIFGPIPMFASSLLIVALLYFLDHNSTPLHEYQPLGQSSIMATDKMASPAMLPGLGDMSKGPILNMTLDSPVLNNL